MQAAIGAQGDGVGAGDVEAFQKGVLADGPVDFLLQVGRGQLQQVDGLLQLWRQRELLLLAELKGGLQGRGTAVPAVVFPESLPPARRRGGGGPTGGPCCRDEGRPVLWRWRAHIRKSSPR